MIEATYCGNAGADVVPNIITEGIRWFEANQRCVGSVQRNTAEISKIVSMHTRKCVVNSLKTIPGGSFEETEHVYKDARGRRIASVTQVFALLGMIDYSRVREEILERKSQLGVAVHAAVQYLCEGCLDWDTVATEAMPYVVGAEFWMKEQGFVSVAQEEQGIHTTNGMSYGYMMDHRGTMMYKGRHRHVILDLKTCVAESPTWELQTAAYALAAPKLPNGEKYLRVILQLKADGKAKPHYFENREDENSFLYALYTAIWKLNRGYTIEN